MTSTVLILGASGRFGRNAAMAFSQAGWIVTKFDRSCDDLMEKARGVDVIVNAWNPAYTDWAKDIPEQTRDVIAAAQASGATIIIPGNVYVFGADAPQRFAEDAAHRAKNHLGRIRVEMERAYRDAGVKTIVLRAGDYIDTEASGNWFDMIITAKLGRGKISYPGALDAPHAWAYLPDMARATVLLAEMRDELAVFEDVPFAGYTLTGAELGAKIADLVPGTVKVTRMSWLPLRLISPFWALGRRLIEMRYLWNKPHHLDGARMAHLLPGFKETPLAEALATALSDHVHPNQAMSGAVYQ